jgi:sterol carrier protein 2
MGRKVYVVGVGMTKFEKPGSKQWDYPDMAREAGQKALADAKIPYDAVEQVAVGYCYGDSTAGQRAAYEIGLSGVPIYNVNNNCSTGSTALYMAKQLVEGGLADCAMALGFEKMEKGSLGIKYTDRTVPMDKHMKAMVEKRGFAKAPAAPQMFGNAGREHMEKYGTKPEVFAKIGWKNHKHSVNNPYSQFQDEYSLEDILNAPMVYEPLTKLQCCPTSDGGGAAILASEDFVEKHGLQAQAVEIAGMAMTTDTPSSFTEKSDIKLVGWDMSRAAALKAYEQATTYGGRWVVNPSGGLISKGHPLGATGLAQCAELNWQLRGLAEKRQVADAKVAIQHNIGLGGAAVVAVYKKPAA